MNNHKKQQPISRQAKRIGYRLRPSFILNTSQDRENLFYTLRARLFLLFLITLLVPMGLLAIINLRSSRDVLEKSTNQILLFSASQLASEIDSFLNSTSMGISGDAQMSGFSTFLSLPEEQRNSSEQELLATTVLQNNHSKQSLLNPYFLGYQLLNDKGEIVLSTADRSTTLDAPYLGLNKVDPASFEKVISNSGSYVSPVLLTEDGSTSHLYFAASVTADNQQTLGILLGIFDGAALQALVEKHHGNAGPESYAVIYDEFSLRLAHSENPGLLFQPASRLESRTTALLQTNRRLPSHFNNKDTPENSSLADGLAAASHNPFFTAPSDDFNKGLHLGAAVGLKSKPWLVTFMQPQATYLAPAREQTRNMLIIFALFIVASIFLAVFITRRLTLPITRLTRAAERVTTGDLWIQAPEGQDEIGALGAAFNSMTAELRRTMDGLEHRVAERTAELAKATKHAQRRAEQLQIVSEVARTIASIQDPENLLSRVTHLISERFGYYHVGIFLVDKAKEYAVLQAANSEGGQRMLSRHHRMKIGQEGLVGHVASSAEPRIALDVGADAVFFDNSDLPYTRSEIALPLKVGEEVIGVLDVQTMEQEAFSEENIVLLSTLADQVAIAIENVHLLSEAQNALAELETSHRQYLQDAWSQASIRHGRSGYQYSFGKVIPAPFQVSPEIWNKLEQAAAPIIIDAVMDKDNEGKSENEDLLAVPITVRGQVIGMLNLEDSRPGREWSDEDISLAKNVAEQVGLAIENARLIKQTQRRAEREHLVAEITNKMRASNDPQAILETAARELRSALNAQHAKVIIPPPKQPSRPTESSSQENPAAGERTPDNNDHPVP
jgi:GAF domain-containing protein/HAMP domain-containing protein